ncbi:hypothetical protein LSH36_91g03047 [Paralvinella palmiformis]|uniref:Homeobox domain-containing protein n=1 Tax=Paralvinella palmiformis TaxID=53620 RepID=A0AAD9NAE2_9ANNE|nr:hypothetical protein LSH36_91g03047 [Paralvinella palmiformis]
MTMASPFHPWCPMRTDNHERPSGLVPYLPGSSSSVYPGQRFPPFRLQTQFPHPAIQARETQFYGLPRLDPRPSFGYPMAVQDQRPYYQYGQPIGALLDRDVTFGTEMNSPTSEHGSVNDSKIELNADVEDDEDSGSVSSRHSESHDSGSEDDSKKPKNNETKYPDYCRTLTVKDASGQIKELVFPKALDLDRPKRARTTFSPDQLVTLEREFHKNQYLVGRERTELAQRLGLSETQWLGILGSSCLMASRIPVWTQIRSQEFIKDKRLDLLCKA